MASRSARWLPVAGMLLLGSLSGTDGGAAEPSNKRVKMDSYGDPLPPLARLRIGTTRFRHGAEITAIAFAPDGRSIASASHDNTLSLWDVKSGKGLARFRAPGCVALSFAAGGKLLLWCNTRGTLYRCDTGQRGEDLAGQREQVHRSNLGSSERIEAVAFTPDGSVAALGTSGHHVLFWGRKVEMKLRDGIQGLALDRDGRLLAVNKGHEGVSLHDVSAKKESRGPLRSFGTDSVRNLMFAPDGRTLAAGDYENHIRLWDVTTGRELRLLEGHRRVPVSGKNGVFCLAFSPDGATLASGAADGTVRLWDVKTGKETTRCASNGGRIGALAFAPDGKTLASGGSDNALHLWNPATGRAIGPGKDAGAALSGMAVSPDGRTLALVRMPGQLSLWGATGKEQPRLSATVVAAAFLPDGRTLAAASPTGSVHFWNIVNGEEAQLPQNIRSVARLLAAAGDGKTIAWYGSDRRIVLWDRKASKELRQLRPPGNTLTSLLFTPDSQTLISTDSAGVRLWSVKGSVADRDISDKVGGVLAAAGSPDGRMLATGGQDGSVRLWEIASGKQRRAMSGDAAFVRAVAFSADGTRLATGSSNGTVRLWDVVTGQRLHTFAGHRGAVVAVAFAGRDSTLITASQDATALVWDLPALLEGSRSRVLELSTRQLQTLWRDLGSEDAAAAYEAVQTLAPAPGQTVPFLAEHVPPVTAEKLARLLKELDSDTFEVRIQAMKAVAQMGQFAEPSLRKLLAGKPSLEARRRAEELLTLLADPAAMTEHLLRRAWCRSVGDDRHRAGATDTTDPRGRRS